MSGSSRTCSLMDLLALLLEREPFLDSPSLSESDADIHADSFPISSSGHFSSTSTARALPARTEPLFEAGTEEDCLTGTIRQDFGSDPTGISSSFSFSSSSASPALFPPSASDSEPVLMPSGATSAKARTREDEAFEGPARTRADPSTVLELLATAACRLVNSSQMVRASRAVSPNCAMLLFRPFDRSNEIPHSLTAAMANSLAFASFLMAD